MSNNNKLQNILTIVFFTLAVVILLITLLLVYTPLKDLFFKKPTAEVTGEELAEETTFKEQTTQEPTEITTKETEETTEEIKIIEEPYTLRNPKTDEIKIPKHQGIIKDIDYENRIITIGNFVNGEIETLDKIIPHVDLISIKNGKAYYKKDGIKFEDIKIGYYVVFETRGDLDPYTHFDPNEVIGILFSEERWW